MRQQKITFGELREMGVHGVLEELLGSLSLLRHESQPDVVKMGAASDSRFCPAESARDLVLSTPSRRHRH